MFPPLASPDSCQNHKYFPVQNDTALAKTTNKPKGKKKKQKNIKNEKGNSLKVTNCDES